MVVTLQKRTVHPDLPWLHSFTPDCPVSTWLADDRYPRRGSRSPLALTPCPWTGLSSCGDCRDTTIHIDFVERGAYLHVWCFVSTARARRLAPNGNEGESSSDPTSTPQRGELGQMARKTVMPGSSHQPGSSHPQRVHEEPHRSCPAACTTAATHSPFSLDPPRRTIVNYRELSWTMVELVPPPC